MFALGGVSWAPGAALGKTSRYMSEGGKKGVGRLTRRAGCMCVCVCMGVYKE
jgi:hypothetical protein